MSNIYTSHAILNTTTYRITFPSIYEGQYPRISYMIGSFASQKNMFTTISICVLLFNIAVQCKPTSDEEENSYNIIIDDIKWLTAIIFIVIVCAAFFCLTDTQPKPECCYKDKPQVIHVHIDPCDTVKHHHYRPTDNQYYPSAPPIYT